MTRTYYDFILEYKLELNRGNDLIQIGQNPRVVRHPFIFYNAVLVDDENGAFGQAFEAGQVFVLNPILGDDLFIVIAQEGEIEPHLFGKCLVAEGAIRTDANNLGVQTPNLSSAVSEPSPLSRSQPLQVSGEIKKVKDEDDFFVFKHVAQRHFVFQGGGKGKIRGFVSDVYLCHNTPP